MWWAALWAYRSTETVPDHIFDDADEVIVVDILPEELPGRPISRASIYPLSRPRAASRNFARAWLRLRELALRCNVLIVSMRTCVTTTAASAHRRCSAHARAPAGRASAAAPVTIPCAPGGSPARRLEADWVVVEVDAPERQHRPGRRRRPCSRPWRWRRAARKRPPFPVPSVAQALVDFARERNASHLRWRVCMNLEPLAALACLQPVRTDRCAGSRPGRAAAVRQAKQEREHLGDCRRRVKTIPWKGYAGVTLYFAWPRQAVADAAAASVRSGQCGHAFSCWWWCCQPCAGDAALSMGGPAVKVLLFDFYLCRRVLFSVNDTQYLFTFSLMLGVALVCGQLTARLRHEARGPQSAKGGPAAGCGWARDLSGALTQEQVTPQIALTTISGVFDAQTGLLVPDADERLQLAPGSEAQIDTSVGRGA